MILYHVLSYFQEKLFRVAGLPMVDNCMSGYNSCMFAYGQVWLERTFLLSYLIYYEVGFVFFSFHLSMSSDR